ncbi:hypothetical protein [Planosporangium thailandense]|uniref:hypothetical protein n=1 Tax=Planosporangium thailandense TaxID=765197 RepID=UPI003B832CDF
MIEDGIPEIAQARRLGHRLGGVRGIYSHVTPRHAPTPRRRAATPLGTPPAVGAGHRRRQWPRGGGGAGGVTATAPDRAWGSTVDVHRDAPQASLRRSCAPSLLPT